MAVVRADQLKEGMVVADNVYSKAGQLIVAQNAVLSNQIINYINLYRISEVTILQGELPDEVKENMAIKKEVEQTHLSKVLESEEYKKFRNTYNAQASMLEDKFNDIILKNSEIEESSMISQTVQLFDENPTTFSLLGMLHSVKQIDDSTYAHSVNVSIISRLIGSWMNFPEDDLDTLTLAGLLHDIGKCRIPDEILLKPGKLTDEEFKMIKMHPQFGYEILRGQNIDDRVKGAALFHHERCDGKGYPFGYDGTRLTDFSCIVSIADVYDAMTANRCYRSGLCPFDVIATFEKEGLNRYSPKFIMVFLEKIANSYLNSEVLLSDNSIARIIYINKQLTRPIVQAKNGDIIDMSKRLDLYIQAIV